MRTDAGMRYWASRGEAYRIRHAPEMKRDETRRDETDERIWEKKLWKHKSRRDQSKNCDLEILLEEEGKKSRVGTLNGFLDIYQACPTTRYKGIVWIHGQMNDK